MKLVLVLIFLFFGHSSFGQAKVGSFPSGVYELKKLISEIELQFDVRYSYADSIASPQRIKLAAARYSLDDMHREISEQTGLSVTKINSRFYSLVKTEIAAEILDEVVVAQYLSQGIRKSANKFIISPQKIEELPGVTDADLLFSLQQLPGVKSPNETAAGLHIRGGTADQNLILWDGIRIYHPGHLFGMISPFNSAVEQKIDYHYKGTSPNFGERISSVIDIRTNERIEDTLQGSAGINGLNGDIYLQFPLVEEKLGVEVSARKSFTELVQSPTFNSLADKVFQNTSFKDFDGNEFGYQDYFLKLTYAMNNRNLINGTAILVDNHLDFISENEDGKLNQMMDIINYGYSLVWERKYASNLMHRAKLYFSGYDFKYVENQLYTDDDFERFTKLNRIVDSGADIDLKYSINEPITVNFGYQLAGNDVSHSFETATPDFEVRLDQKHLYNVTNAFYGNFAYDTDAWNISAGLRFNKYSAVDETSLEPRVFVRRKVFRDLSVEATYERKSQMMSQIRETVANDMSLENYVWILQDGKDFPLQTAEQYSIGASYRTKSWLVDLDAYYKQIRGITSLSFGFLHEFDSSVHQGEGFTKGVDLLLQKSAETWRAWITYTFQESQNRYDQLNDQRYFPIYADISHSVTLSAFKKWNSFSVSAGWFWHTGRPYSTLDDSGRVISFNNKRLSSYHRLDMSAAYEIRKLKSVTGKIGFSILNLYGNDAVISKEFQRSYASIGDLFESSYSVRNYRMLGFTPNFFVRVIF